MSQLTKTLIKCFICFIMIIAVIFAYGLTIGGYPGIVFYIIMGTVYFIALLIIKGKELFKKKYILFIILIITVGITLNTYFYHLFNKSFDNSEPIRSYYSTVDEYPGSAPFEDIMWFKDPEGNTKESTEYSLVFDKPFEIGDKIFVEEYKGVFNVGYYNIVKDEEISMDLEKSLKEFSSNAKTVNDYINGFEEFCKVDSGDSEEVCFLETGNYDFSGENEFYFSLVRQYKEDANEDEYTQVHMDIIFEPIDSNIETQIWSDEFDNNKEFFNAVESSEAFKYINDNYLNPKRIDIYTDET